jgi:hypothetical protein
VIISGQVHRVDEPLQAFIPRYLKSKGHPTDGFVDWGGTHVYCVILPTQHEPAPNGTGFEPYLSTSANADDKGRFKVEVPDAFQPLFAYLVVYSPITVSSMIPSPGLPPIPVLNQAVVYRSATFALADVTTARQHLYISNETVSNDQGFSQAQVTAAAAAIRSSAGLDSIRALVTDNDVDVQAQRSGAVVGFDLRLRASTSWDLDTFADVRVDNFVLDLPGPDFITGICVDEAAIEKSVRKSVKTLDKLVNKQIDALIPAGVDGLVSVTVRGFRFPVTKTMTIPMPTPSGNPSTTTLRARSIVADPCVGLPKLPYSTLN